MPTPAHTVTCTKYELIAPGVYELCFSKPETFTFKAGQFVLFDIPLLENPADIQTRALSIASSPGERELIFVVKVKPEGRLGRWIVHALKKGVSVRIQGPLGLFTVRSADQESELVFAATGAGVAPFRSQLIAALDEAADPRPMHLLFGVRHRTDLFWVDHFQTLASRHAHFHFHPSLSGDEPGWTGLRGRVQVHLHSLATTLSKPGVYICGAPEMVQDLKSLCIGELGIPKTQVHAEGYI